MGEITMKNLKIFIALILFLSITACDLPASNSDQDQRKQTEKMVKAANQSVGMPNITNFTEKRFTKLIYELKDSEIATFSYFMDMNGHLHFLCESVGYGMPASVQYVNPDRYKDCGQSCGVTLPQPEPNGLFMPEGLDATFVLCSDGKGGVKPIYSEPKLIVSPFKLKQTTSLRN